MPSITCVSLPTVGELGSQVRFPNNFVASWDSLNSTGVLRPYKITEENEVVSRISKTCFGEYNCKLFSQVEVCIRAFTDS